MEFSLEPTCQISCCLFRQWPVHIQVGRYFRSGMQQNYLSAIQHARISPLISFAKIKIRARLCFSRNIYQPPGYELVTALRFSRDVTSPQWFQVTKDPTQHIDSMPVSWYYCLLLANVSYKKVWHGDIGYCWIFNGVSLVKQRASKWHLWIHAAYYM